ncbi:hypothetical protein Taro_028483 [Colocasia esculenta]|uniref:Uncharacterized protein n=1 Tax=Colocasia esculenta TaxID=4460 RepID=A0A843VGK5_COLES|nr:hypothetical protein [Colocasia esculenta]
MSSPRSIPFTCNYLTFRYSASGRDSLSRYLCCTVEVWCWLVSTVLWLMLVERQLDLSFVTVRLRESDSLELDPAIFHDKRLAGAKEEASPTSPWCGDHPGARRKKI